MSENNDNNPTLADNPQQLPPTANDDAFGVRAGALVALPVLYNDTDPNKDDVLTVDRSQGHELKLADASFGTLSLTGDDQTIAIQVAPGAHGTTTFEYWASDGSGPSKTSAKVTLHVVPVGSDAPPVWCGALPTDPCPDEAAAPAVTVAPGKTTTFDAMYGMVDPDGDGFVVSGVAATKNAQDIDLLPTGDGKIAVRSVSSSTPDGESIPLEITYTDSQGKPTTRVDVSVTISSGASISLDHAVFVGTPGLGTTVSVDEFVTGAAGDVTLTDAFAAKGGGTAADFTVDPNPANNTITLTAKDVGDYFATVKVKQGSQPATTGTIRYSVVAAATGLTIPPLTAFIQAGQDSTVGVLDSVQNPSGAVLVLKSAQVESKDGAHLEAQLVGQDRVRVAGTTPDGKPGRVGTVDIDVVARDGALEAQGRITVFLVTTETNGVPIARDDHASVRASAGGQVHVVDIPILANDYSPQGENAVVAPDLGVCPGASGEQLAFVSGDIVRFVVPEVPSSTTYCYTYETYLPGSPQHATAQVTIDVSPAVGVGLPPAPPVIVGRAAPGQTIVLPVDLAHLDPDGDPATLDSVGPADSDAAGPLPAGSGTAWIATSGDAIVYRAPADGVGSGEVDFRYWVRQVGGDGSSVAGTVRIGVLSDATVDPTPVTFTDRVRGKSGGAALTIEPLLNDSDPSGGTLKIVSVVPAVPATFPAKGSQNAGQPNPAYAKLQALVTTTDEESSSTGVVKIEPGDDLGEHAYTYTVESSLTSLKTTGTIVVTVGDTAVPDAPQVSDTIVTAADYRTLADGVDVVSGKVHWASGDPSTLVVAPVGTAPAGYAFSGTTIRYAGDPSAAGAVVPFELRASGAAADAAPVTYGFLRIPAYQDLRVEVKAAGDHLPESVKQGESVSFDLVADHLLDVAQADAVGVQVGSQTPAVQTAGASCVSAVGRPSATPPRTIPTRRTATRARSRSASRARPARTRWRSSRSR